MGAPAEDNETSAGKPKVATPAPAEPTPATPAPTEAPAS